MLGSTLGHFRITGKLGEGGMGVVYRAEDLNLGREVAVKVLPESFVADPERLARFEREARILASLSHPNIAAIHEIGEEADVRFLVMEIAPGRSLAERLSRDPLGLEEALRMAVGIAAALETAHLGGVVHRDLKPANVMVDEEGGVKVLDFGLGKMLHPPPGAATAERLSESPTLSDQMTQAHVRLGTAPYMSPEQVSGKPADPRSDVWSFGCTLYQSLTGRLPFRGDSTIDVFGAILHEDPDLDALPPETPPAVRRLVARCLRRDRQRRLQSMGDARVLLEDVLAGVGDEPTEEPVAAAVANRRTERIWKGLALTAMALAALAALPWLFGSLGRDVAMPAEVRFQKLTEIEGIETTPSLSPDGASVAFAADEDGDFDIYIQRIDGRRAINLTSDSVEDDIQPAYSHDGTRIAFRSERLGGGIFVMGATGESVRRLTDFGYHPSWSPDGESLVVATESVQRPDQRHTTSQLWVVDVASGERRLLHEGDAELPAWSPQGHRIAFWGLRSGSGQRDVWTIAATGGEAVPVTEDSFIDWSPAWSADGSRLYFLSDRGGAMNVWWISIDEVSGRPGGTPRTLTAPTRQASFLTVAQDSYVYSDVDRRDNLWRASFDPERSRVTEPLEPVTQGSHEYGNVHASPTGDRLAFVSWGVQQDVFVAGVDGSGVRRLTDDVHRDRFPRWSPDGDRLLFYSDREGRYDVWSVGADGSGLTRHTDGRGGSIMYAIWSPRGDRAVATQQLATPFFFDPNQSWEGQETEQLPSLDEGWFQATDWSPDGSRLVGVQRLADGSSSAVLSYELDEERYGVLRERTSPPISNAHQIRWLPDSQRLVLIEDGAIQLLDSRTGELQRILEPPPGGRRSYTYLDLTDDGRTLFVIVRSESADLWRAGFGD